MIEKPIIRLWPQRDCVVERMGGSCGGGVQLIVIVAGCSGRSGPFLTFYAQMGVGMLLLLCRGSISGTSSLDKRSLVGISDY